PSRSRLCAHPRRSRRLILHPKPDVRSGSGLRLLRILLNWRKLLGRRVEAPAGFWLFGEGFDREGALATRIALYYAQGRRRWICRHRSSCALAALLSSRPRVGWSCAVAIHRLW